MSNIFKNITGALKNMNSKPQTTPVINTVPQRQNSMYITPQRTKVVVMTPEQIKIQNEYRMMIFKYVAIGIVVVIIISTIASLFSKKKEDEEFTSVDAVDPLAKIQLYFGIFGALVAILAGIYIYINKK
jgi:hypothetical protein